jgi:hypothetical protein
MNTVVGSPGTKAPMTPSTRHNMAKASSAQRASSGSVRCTGGAGGLAPFPVGVGLPAEECMGGFVWAEKRASCIVPVGLYCGSQWACPQYRYAVARLAVRAGA